MAGVRHLPKRVGERHNQLASPFNERRSALAAPFRKYTLEARLSSSPRVRAR